jgi:capsular polysaccharide biosynthesis protein
VSAWHEPETGDGEIARISHPAVTISPSLSLLGQEHPLFVLDSGEHRFRWNGIAPAHTTSFWSLESAGVLGEDGLVYCPQVRAAVAETARTIFRPAGSHPCLSCDHPAPVRLPGVSLLLAGPFGHAHYHLIWDYLAKLALLPEALRPSVDHYLLGVPQTPNAIDWLRTAGVPVEQFVWLTSNSHLLCDQVIFSTLPCGVTQPRPAVVQALRSLLAVPAPPNPHRWLWISRRSQSQRDLVWEGLIIKAFPKFERLDLATLPAREQIRAFAEASVIAGPHGSGLANLAFVQGAGDLVELFPLDHRGDPVFGRIAHLVGWRHSWARVDFKQPTTLDAVVVAIQTRLSTR